jgi:hypothetical protein
VRFHRIAGLFVALAAAAGMAPGAAHAGPYPVEPPPASVSDGTVSNGGTVTFSGTGFLPFEKISITVNYSGSNSAAALRLHAGDDFPLAFRRAAAVAELPRRVTLSATADAAGSFSLTVRLSEVGNATLVATGLTSGHTVTANVEVVAPSDDETTPDTDDDNNNNNTALPTTGPSAAPLLLTVSGGLGLVFLGTVILWYFRGRRTSAQRS